MNSDDVKKTIYITKTSLYEWLVIPFGLKHATNTFSRTMMNIFLEWLQQFLKVFVDDLNIHSITWEYHFNHIHVVLQRLKDVNLKFNSNNCVFSTKNIRFLGHVVGNVGT
jgi:putative transposase